MQLQFSLTIDKLRDGWNPFARYRHSCIWWSTSHCVYPFSERNRLSFHYSTVCIPVCPSQSHTHSRATNATSHESASSAITTNNFSSWVLSTCQSPLYWTWQGFDHWLEVHRKLYIVCGVGVGWGRVVRTLIRMAWKTEYGGAPNRSERLRFTGV